MHVYIRENPVALEMRQTDPEGLVNGDEGLVPVAFFVEGNERPSFRALLPPETLMVLEEALLEPVQIGLLADEPETPEAEIQAMVGLTLPVEGLPDGTEQEEDEDDEREPWATGDSEAWRGGGAADDDGEDSEGGQRTVFLAFAPLVRLARKFPVDFGEELADLLESALAGDTRPSLEARVDRMLGGL
jgi:hypothetical protein